MVTWNVILSSCLKRTHFPPATISVKHSLTCTLKDNMRLHKLYSICT